MELFHWTGFCACLMLFFFACDVDGGYSKTCMSQTSHKHGACGSNLANQIQSICKSGLKPMKKRSIEVLSNDDAPFLSKMEAFSTITKRSERAAGIVKRSSYRHNLVCECCVHQCSFFELYEYCDIPTKKRSPLLNILKSSSEKRFMLQDEDDRSDHSDVNQSVAQDHLDVSPGQDETVKLQNNSNEDDRDFLNVISSTAKASHENQAIRNSGSNLSSNEESRVTKIASQNFHDGVKNIQTHQDDDISYIVLKIPTLIKRMLVSKFGDTNVF